MASAHDLYHQQQQQLLLQAAPSGALAGAAGGTAAERLRFMQQLWRDRLKGVQRHVEVRP